MTLPSRSALVAAVGAATLAAATTAAAAGGVSPARGSTRSALVHAFVVQDGSSAGIHGTYVARSHPQTGVVCQQTPDAGTVRFLFRRAGRSWRFLFSSRGTRTGTSLDRALERACR